MKRFRAPKYFAGNYDKKTLVPRDRPSLYLGGNSHELECDVGLTWDRIFRSDGLPVYTDKLDGNSQGVPENEFHVELDAGTPVLKRGDGVDVVRGRAQVEERVAQLAAAHAYRPYWRAVDSVKGNYWNTEPVTSSQNLYFYPEQEIRIELRVVGRQLMELLVAADTYEFRKRFEQLKWGPGETTVWKRVNSIDQDGTECRGISKKIVTETGVKFVGMKDGKECGVQPTKTNVKGAVWKSVFLLDRSGAKTPFACNVFIERGMDIIPSYNKVFTYSSPHPVTGAMTVDIDPSRK